MENHIFENDVEEYRTGPNKFGICMASYQRRSGKTPAYLKRSLEAILNQTATNWHLYLVGDKYENNEEFLQCISFFPKDKLTYVNLSYANERDNISNRNNLWMVGGCNAMNTSHKLALEGGCSYIVHHDDDDYFNPKKLQILNYTLSIHPDPICIFHYSKHLDKVLPSQVFTGLKTSIEDLYNLPCPGNVNHSALTIHRSIAESFKYDGYRPGKVHYECGDIQLLKYIIQKATNDNKNYTVFVPLLLCTHDSEGNL